MVSLSIAGLSMKAKPQAVPGWPIPASPYCSCSEGQTEPCTLWQANHLMQITKAAAMHASAVETSVQQNCEPPGLQLLIITRSQSSEQLYQPSVPRFARSWEHPVLPVISDYQNPVSPLSYD